MPRFARRHPPAGALAACAFATLVATGALAQPKPALVKDADAPGLNPYHESVQLDQDVSRCQVAPPSFNNCRFTLSAVPAGKRLVITYASISYFVSPGATFPEVLLTAPFRFVQLPLPTVQSSSLVDRLWVASPVTFYVEPGDAPAFLVRAFDILDGRMASMSLTGYYVNLP